MLIKKNSLPITNEDIAWLWMSMTKAFGFKFIQNYGDCDNGIWFEGLSDMTAADLAYGFKKMLVTITPQEREKREVWPPNLKEFRMYCEERPKYFDNDKHDFESIITESKEKLKQVEADMKVVNESLSSNKSSNEIRLILQSYQKLDVRRAHLVNQIEKAMNELNHCKAESDFLKRNIL